MRIEIKTSSMKDPQLDLMSLEKRRKYLLQLMTGITKTVEVIKSAASSGSLKRAVMGFDQLNRLASVSGKGKATKELVTESLNPWTKEPAYWEALEKASDTVVDAMDKMVGLKEVNRQLSGDMDRVSTSGNAMNRMLAGLGQMTQDLVVGTKAFQLSVDGMNMDMMGMGAAAEEAKNGLKRALQPTGTWFHSTVYAPIRADIATLWDGMEPEARQSMNQVEKLFANAGDRFSTVFSNAWKKVEGVFSSGGNVFEGLKNGVLSGFKSMVNKLIGGVNDVVVKPFAGINNLFTTLRNFSIGGVKPFKNLNFSIPMPQIPYLAQGAVLPANKPFMAVLGDQRHGTNIEAPLDTIRQAVAEVMAESVDAQLAGHSATVEVLGQILDAVLGISLDDGVVGRAVERHRQRLAVMRGGY